MKLYPQETYTLLAHEQRCYCLLHFGPRPRTSISTPANASATAAVQRPRWWYRQSFQSFRILQDLCEAPDQLSQSNVLSSLEPTCKTKKSNFNILQPSEHMRTRQVNRRGARRTHHDYGMCPKNAGSGSTFLMLFGFQNNVLFFAGQTVKILSCLPITLQMGHWNT